MRIGLFIDTMNFGGAESVVISIVEFLAGSEHTPIVYHFGNPSLSEACKRLGVECRIVGHWRLYKKTLLTPFFAYPFSRMLKKDRIDVLHSHLSGSIVGGSAASRMAGIAHVGTLHDVYVIQERPIRARLLKLAHLLGTRLVCVSDEMADYYAGVTGIARERIRVIRNGVDLERFAGRARLPGGGAELQLLMVGRLDPIKRHDLMLDALAGLPASIRWRLRIAGEGPERASLESRVESLELGSRVEFLGQRGDVDELLAEADVFALVSDSEGMSLSLIEAIASGLPVVATDVGNNAELVVDGRNGLVVPPGRVDDLRAALATLLSDRAKLASFAEQSRRLSRATLDFGRTMAAYIDMYQSATAGA